VKLLGLYQLLTSGIGYHKSDDTCQYHVALVSTDTHYHALLC